MIEGRQCQDSAAMTTVHIDELHFQLVLWTFLLVMIDFFPFPKLKSNLEKNVGECEMHFISSRNVE